MPECCRRLRRQWFLKAKPPRRSRVVNLEFVFEITEKEQLRRAKGAMWSARDLRMGV
jgi:hypothetical protein